MPEALYKELSYLYFLFEPLSESELQKTKPKVAGLNMAKFKELAEAKEKKSMKALAEKGTRKKKPKLEKEDLEEAEDSYAFVSSATTQNQNELVDQEKAGKL